MVKPIWNNAQRMNHQKFAKKTHPCAKKNLVPRAILIKSGLVSVNTARQVNTAHSKITVNAARPMSYLFKTKHSTVKRPIHKNTSFKNNNIDQRVNIVRGKNFNTARLKAVVNAVKGNNFNVVKTSTCWVWKPKHKVLDHGNPQMDLQDQGVIDSGCSRHMKGNMSYLTDYKEIDGEYVAFGGNPKGGKIIKKVFFLATKDETSGILKSFITEIENLLDHKVKVIRCDNGTEFKNKEMNQFYEMNGILRQFSVARTPQQMGSCLKSKALEYSNSRTWRSRRKPCILVICKDQEKEDSVNNTNIVNTADNVNTVSLTVNAAGTNEVNVGGKTSIELLYDPNMPALEDDIIFDFSRDDEDDGAVADINNLDTTIHVSPNLTIRIHKDHPLDKVIGDLQSATQTRKLSKNLEEHGFISPVWGCDSMRHALKGQIGGGKGHPTGILLANNAPGCKGRDTFGLPRIIVTDNGTNLANDPFKSCCKKLNIQQINTVIAHPHANGLVEQANRSLMEGIKMKTSYSLTFRSEAIIPTEIGMPTHRIMMVKDGNGNEEEMRLNLDLLQERREAATIREAIYKMKMEHYYNKRVRPKSFKVGDYVYRRNKASHVENLGKLGVKWEVPYSVIEAYQNASYKL
ncbi:ribonuclease H-like domain-containing protein [Tanacetum coccineum]